MEICIFYSWQSCYRNNCDKIITKALEKAVKELNAEDTQLQFYLQRGGGDVLGAESISEKVNETISTRADLAFVDFTHIGKVPQKDESTGEWLREKCIPNPNALNENGRLENALGLRQVSRCIIPHMEI